MINVEYDSKGEVIILVDMLGAEKLREYLTELIKGKETHYHLMTPSWSGIDLDEYLINKDYELINQVRIQLVPTEQDK